MQSALLAFLSCRHVAAAGALPPLLPQRLAGREIHCTQPENDKMRTNVTIGTIGKCLLFADISNRFASDT